MSKSTTTTAPEKPDAGTQPGPGDDVTLPASFEQERLWFLDRIEPGSPVYNIPLAYEIGGGLNIEALKAAFVDVVRHHEALRTNFTSENGTLLQVIHETARCPFDVIDLRATAPGDRESRAGDLTRSFCRTPFDLAKDPLLRVLVLALSSDRHLLALNVHHSIFDGGSLTILLDELGACYSARVGGFDSTLKPLPIQYGDFAAWQREQLDGPLLAGQLAFWKEHLADIPPQLELPGDKQPPASPTSEGGDFFFPIPDEVTASLRTLCQREGVTLFMALMAGFQALLFRYTGQERLLVGMPVANRSRSETERLIGLFVNTVTVRGDFRGDPTVRDLLASVRDETLAAVSNGDLPFEKLVEQLKPGHRDGRNPLFRTMLVLQQQGFPSGFSGLSLAPKPVELGAAKLDLLIEMVDTGSALGGGVSYSTDLFEPATIHRLAGHFVTLLRGMAESPERRISSLPLLTPQEQGQLRGWNRTSRAFPEDQSIASLFETQVAATPNATAVIDGTERLTYETLDSRANAVAHDLQSRGVRAGSIVGLPAERSARFIVAILGVLKAGGAYMPLDHAEPEERARMMRSHCTCVLTWETMREVSGEPFRATEAVPQSPAYVLFTSGSTGTPKGVIIPHRAISRLVLNTDLAPFDASDVFAFASNVCFDAATFEIWGALLNGGSTVVVPQDVLLSPRELGAFLSAHAITALFVTTSLFNQIAAIAPATFARVRCVIFGGESADAHAVRQIIAHGKPARLLNAYGPTETTTFATGHVIERIEGDRIPIGRPLANNTAQILDTFLNDVPIGVPGHLYIGGPGVAIGYLDNPALTSERFVETSHGRLYKTGDRAAWRADGTIEFHGRADSQIKLRGFRIEPGEIETALQSHPEVRQAAVLAREQPGGERALVGYLIARGSASPDAGELRTFLAARLPAYMIPALWVWLDALPLTPNGKLDHRSLPAPSCAESESQPVKLAPRNAIEKHVAELWTRVLGRNGFSIRDDFFTLGGHSLLALRVLGEIESKFGVAVPARRLFETPTIEGLAQFVSDQLHTPPSPQPAHGNLTEIQRGDPTRPPLFLVPGGWGGEIEFLVYAELSRHLDPGLPIWGLKARGAGTGESPHASVTEMAADYVREVRRIQPHGPYFIAGECVGGVCAHEMACQFENEGESVALLVLLDTTVPAHNHLDAYLKSESRKLAPESWAMRTGRRISHHLGQMNGLSIRRKFGYLFTKASGRTESAATPATSPEPPHPRGQKDYPVTLMRHALQPYRGTVTLLLDEESSRLYGNLGWDKISVGRLETHVLPGDHFTYIRENATTAAAKLRELLGPASSNLHHDPATS